VYRIGEFARFFEFKGFVPLKYSQKEEKKTKQNQKLKRKQKHSQ
jgi:hypothetical protein